MSEDTKRALIAVVLSGLILFGWQVYFAPPSTKPTDVATAPTPVVNDPALVPISAAPVVANISRSELTLAGSGGELKIANDLSISSISNSKSVFDFQSVVEAEKPLKLFLKKDSQLVDIPLQFNSIDGVLVGSNDSLGIKATIKPNSASGRYDVALVSSTPAKFVFQMKSNKKELQNRQLREFAVLLQDVERVQFGKSLKEEGQIKWFGVDFNYHLFAVVFAEKQTGSVEVKESGDVEFIASQESTNFNFSYLFAKKNYDDLVNMGDNLNLSVDFGILGIVAVPLLRGLQFFYKYLPNYGIAIIILTILVRLATFPLQYKSFKSMKKMQELQPELTKIKEKYKDDAQRMQKETMELFKRAGTNPLGGCLPLLAQMPVFFAFYKVLYSAVELVNAPFFGWIHDLSAKDPFYILPLLMTGAMFLQQKMTPSTSMDPTQQKIMLFMPLVFGLIMKDLPSGLVLYIFISTLAGIIQQMLVYKTTD